MEAIRKEVYMDKIKARALKEKFLNEFLLEDGKLHNILKIIQNDNSLIMCLRGNYTTVYYRGLQILKIKPNGFDVDTGYGIEKPLLKYDGDYWVEYFKGAKQKIDEHCSMGKANLEKEIQQIIFRENSCNSMANETDYFIFDLEYALQKKRKRFDAIAIFWPRKDRRYGKKTELAIIEIKAGFKAIKGKSGLFEHYNDVKNFLGSVDKEAFLVDMKNMFSQMKKLGLINIKANPDKLSLGKNKMQFIFALANYNDNSIALRQEIQKIEVDPNASFETYFAKSSLLGYGLYEKGMVRVEEML